MMTASKQSGISLLEIMVALSLGAFMLVGIISMMASVSGTRTELNRTSEQTENGRFALQVIAEELALAGFFGTYYTEDIDYTDPPPCVDLTNIDALGVRYIDTSTSPQLPAAVGGYAATTAGKPSCITDADKGGLITNGEILVMRRVVEEPVAKASAATGTHYLQVSGCTGENDFTFSKSGSGAFLLRQKDCSTAVADVWPYTITAFFASKCDDCSGGGNGDGIPTLKSVELVDGAWQTVTLVEGVEDIHFKYGIDLDDNGAPDCYVDDPRADDLSAGGTGCPSAGAGTAAYITNFSNVVAVEVSLLIRSLDASPGAAIARTYDLGRALPESRNDNYRRKVHRSVILVQNVSGARE